MKKLLLCVLGSLFFLNAYTQVQEIKNFSFENWTSNNGLLYPDDWTINTANAIESNAIAGVNNHTDGNYAILFGSCYDNGTLIGTQVSQYDNLTSSIAGITFDYLVQNNTSSLWNGLSISVYFYAEDGEYLDDFYWSSEQVTNYGNFTQGVFNFTPPANSFQYLLELGYLNVGGSPNEYAIVDNLRFIQGGNAIEQTIKPELELYPNPVSSSINFNNPLGEGSAVITDLSGALLYKATLSASMNSIDLSSLSVGSYILTIESESGIIRRKILKI